MLETTDDSQPPSAPGPRGPGVALVAGASRGLGLEISAQLVKKGWIVHGCARDGAELEGARFLLADRLGPRAAARFLVGVCDVRDPDAVSGWVADAWEASGAVDAAFHVAGVIQVGPLQSVTLEHLRDAVDTMLWGPVHLSLALVPRMRVANRGRIGIVASVGGLVSVPHLLPYSVAKFGAVGLAEGLYAELAGTGVTVTSVTPGLMRTGGHARARFVGDASADYSWFAPAASLPGISVSVERAARRIIAGVLRGSPTVELTPLTMVGRRVHGLAPAATIRLMGVASRLLPEGPVRAASAQGFPGVEGRQVRRTLGSRLVNLFTTFGDRAARRHNEGLEGG